MHSNSFLIFTRSRAKVLTNATRRTGQTILSDAIYTIFSTSSYSKTIIHSNSPIFQTRENLHTYNESRPFVSQSNQRKKELNVFKALELKMRKGSLMHDPVQLKLAKRLAKLQATLTDLKYDSQSLIQVPVVKPELSSSEEKSDTSVEKDFKKEEQEKQISYVLKLRMPRGLYIHGSVGSGKSMIMDLFYESLSFIKKKKRVHFHSFLQSIHVQIHNQRTSGSNSDPNVSNDDETYENPIVRAANAFSSTCNLLCIDEFHLVDICDVLIISQYIQQLWKNGVVVVCTSNTHPHELYSNGSSYQAQHPYVTPFLHSLSKYCFVYCMNQGSRDDNNDNEDDSNDFIDYRKVMAAPSTSITGSEASTNNNNEFVKNIDCVVKGAEESMINLYNKAHGCCFFLTSGSNDDEGYDPMNVKTFDNLFHTFQKMATLHNEGVNISESSYEEEKQIPIEIAYGRYFSITRSNTSLPPTNTFSNNPTDVIRFHIDELCATDHLGISDYRILAQTFPIVMIDLDNSSMTSQITELSVKEHREKYNQMRRFITFIDELYEAKCCLVLKASSSINKIIEHPDDLFVGFRDDEEQGEIGSSMSSTSASIYELSNFATKRASSRLVEMTSQRWWETYLLSSSDSRDSHTPFLDYWNDHIKIRSK